MIGIGIPSRQSGAPLPKPLMVSVVPKLGCKCIGNKEVPWGHNMILIDRIKQWDGHATMTGRRPVWWKRILIRIVVGTKFPKRPAH